MIAQARLFSLDATPPKSAEHEVKPVITTMTYRYVQSIWYQVYFVYAPTSHSGIKYLELVWDR